MSYVNKVTVSTGPTKDTIYIIGALPGLNATIDATGSFEKTLLNNINFIDLIPATYDIKAIQSLINASVTAAQYLAGSKELKDPSSIFKKAFNDIDFSKLYSYNEKVSNISNKYFAKSLNKYLNDNTINENTKNIIRIISSNDSVFSETINNQFGDNDFMESISTNPLMGGAKAIAHNAVNFVNQGIKNFTKVDVKHTIQNIPKYSYGEALNMVTSLSESGYSGNSLSAILAKEFLGMNLALPRIFNESSYNNSLSLFIKLTSPTGLNSDILKYIINPLKILIIASAPFSFDGLTTYIPPVWKIKSYGNTDINIGVIDVITVTRGSLDTTYNDFLQPLSLDVRLTISSLSDRFANVIKTNIKQESLNIGMVTPSIYNESFKKTKKITDVVINL